MIKYFTTLLIFLLTSSFFYAQQKIDSIANLKSELRTFEYNKVIEDADRILLNKSIFTSNELIDIYVMKGISQFSVSNNEGAKESFGEVLKINPSYQLDSTQVSPKIISYFNLVRDAYNKDKINKYASENLKPDTVFIPKVITRIVPDENIKKAFYRSILLPGWGHFYLHENTKGWILTSLSAAAIVSSVYFIIDSNKKENYYLNETNTNLISKDYNLYNTSYKFKNISLISYAVIWIYSQIDILFFQNDSHSNLSSFLFNTKISSDFASNLKLNFILTF